MRNPDFRVEYCDPKKRACDNCAFTKDSDPCLGLRINEGHSRYWAPNLAVALYRVVEANEEILKRLEIEIGRRKKAHGDPTAGYTVSVLEKILYGLETWEQEFKGKVPEVKCPVCDGQGQVRKLDDPGRIVACYACRGVGSVEDFRITKVKGRVTGVDTAGTVEGDYLEGVVCTFSDSSSGSSPAE